MIQYEPDEIIQKFDAMPRAVREYIHDPKTGEAIRAIGQKHGMLLDQIAALVDEVTWVMIGLTSQTSFKERIKELFSLSEETASVVTKEIGDTIVRPVLNQLQNSQVVSSTGLDDATKQEIDTMLNEKIPGIDFDLEGTEGLTESGIEVVNQPVQENTPTETLNRESLLEDVQNPTRIAKTIPAVGAADEIQRGITGEKLAGNFKIPGEQKDYSVNKSAEPAPTSIKVIRHQDRVDPYREPFE